MKCIYDEWELYIIYIAKTELYNETWDVSSWEAGIEKKVESSNIHMYVCWARVFESDFDDKGCFISNGPIFIESYSIKMGPLFLKHPLYSERAWNSLLLCIVIFYHTCVCCKQKLNTLNIPSVDRKSNWPLLETFKLLLLSK
jgi:hypothetical protein